MQLILENVLAGTFRIPSLVHLQALRSFNISDSISVFSLYVFFSHLCSFLISVLYSSLFFSHLYSFLSSVHFLSLFLSNLCFFSSLFFFHLCSILISQLLSSLFFIHFCLVFHLSSFLRSALKVPLNSVLLPLGPKFGTPLLSPGSSESVGAFESARSIKTARRSWKCSTLLKVLAASENGPARHQRSNIVYKT